MSDKFAKWIADSENIVFFGGAGISTESGIPDFRSTEGLYNQEHEYPPETILSHSFFVKHTEVFYRFYKKKMICPEAMPNPAHKILAKWEAQGKLRAVITQNIDGLHQMAGSKEVLELHGSVLRNYCTRCHSSYDVSYILEADKLPKCIKCGGLVKPDVVLYEEALNEEIMRKAVHYIANADVLIVAGTSLAVYPAAGLIDYYQGDKLVLINKMATPRDSCADLLLQGSIGEIFSRLEEGS